MGKLATVAGWFGLQAGGAPTNFDDPRWWGGGGEMTVAGVAVTAERVLQLGAVQAVLAGLSSSIESTPFMLFRRSEIGANVEAKDHPVYRLLRRPNDRQTPAEFFSEQITHLAFWRNAYSVIHPSEDGTQAIGSLEQIHPKRVVEITRGADGRVYYKINNPKGANAQVYRDDQIWHIRRAPLTDDGLRGKAVFETARQVFGRAIAVNEYGDIWFANSGQTGGLLEHPGNFKSVEDRDNFLDNWRAGSTGKSRHRDRLMTHGVKYQPLKVTNAEAQLLETEKSSDVQIFGIWNFPPHKAGRLDRATFSNIEQQSLDYVIACYGPLLEVIEQSVEQSLIIDDDPDLHRFEFNVEPLLQGDTLSRYRALAIGRQWGWLSVNDVRRLIKLNPIDSGDRYLEPLNMQKPGGTDGSGPGDDGSDDTNDGDGKPADK